MKITKQARRDAKALFRSCHVNGLLDEARVRTAVQSVAGSKPRGHVAILSHFVRLVKLDIARRAARVESAVPLTAEQQSQVAASLARRYGAGLNINYAQNAALLGGMRIQVGSDVFDATVQARLNSLADNL